VLANMPKMQIGQPMLNLLNNVFGLGIGGGALLAMGAGVVAGGLVAYHMAAGAEKVDDAIKAADFSANGKPNAVKAYFSELQEYGAEMRSAIQDAGKAESFMGAVKSGFNAGASLGAPVGAISGKVQGLGFGAALGVLASLPIVASLPPVLTTPIMIGAGLLGAAVGAKIGEPVGNVVGSLAAGAVGGLAGAAYHGVRKLTGGGQGEQQPAPPAPAPAPAPQPAPAPAPGQTA
ncbi:MAG: hypothetical protein AB1758_33240, partial [Candidatus Eremiobacterota bacterium]